MDRLTVKNVCLVNSYYAQAAAKEPKFIEPIKPATGADLRFKVTMAAFLATTLCDIESALIVLCTCLTSLYNLTRSQNRHRHVEASTPPNISKKWHTAAKAGTTRTSLRGRGNACQTEILKKQTKITKIAVLLLPEN